MLCRLNWPPHPLTRRRVCPPLWFRGRGHTLAGEEVGGPNSEEGTDTVVLLVYMYFVVYVPLQVDKQKPLTTRLFSH
jgi:hypothetical protein